MGAARMPCPVLDKLSADLVTMDGYARQHGYSADTVARAGIMLDAMSGDGKDGGPVRRPRTIGRPRVPLGPLADLKALIYELYMQAGTPTLDEMAAWIAGDDERSTR